LKVQSMVALHLIFGFVISVGEPIETMLTVGLTCRSLWTCLNLMAR